MKEQIYNDFITKMLPMIEKGLVISKDYFEDLFGRYIQYLIITDVVFAILGVVITAACLFLCYKLYKFSREKIYETEPCFLGIMVLGVFALLSFFLVIDKTLDAIKAVYIPELRVYEELKNM